MKSITFKEVNQIIGADSEGYKQLYVHKTKDQFGDVTSCWKLSLFERIQVLFTGKVWLCQRTFNHDLVNSLITTEKDEVIKK